MKIEGVIFPVDKRDMIMDDGTGEGTCQGGVSDGGTYAPYVLGDVFMKNVMVVFDVGASELRFRSRLVRSRKSVDSCYLLTRSGDIIERKENRFSFQFFSSPLKGRHLNLWTFNLLIGRSEALQSLPLK